MFSCNKYLVTYYIRLIKLLMLERSSSLAPQVSCRHDGVSGGTRQHRSPWEGHPWHWVFVHVRLPKGSCIGKNISQPTHRNFAKNLPLSLCAIFFYIKVTNVYWIMLIVINYSAIHHKNDLIKCLNRFVINEILIGKISFRLKIKRKFA